MSAKRWTLYLILLTRSVFAIQFGDIPANTVEPLSTWVPPTRTLTINGTAFDLSADRTWTISSGITPAALTKTDDTNVTLTLGGTPSTALLQPTSITVGWTGTLSTARGGVATGGTTGQVLAKNSNTNNDIGWISLGSGAPVSATYITEIPDSTLTNEFALSNLATGLLKNTTITGVPTIAAAGTDYEVPLTFSTGLTRSTNTITVNTTQNITNLSNLTTNGFVKTSAGTGTLSIDTNTYLTGNQTISLTGNVTGSGTTSIATTIPNSTITYAKMQNVSGNSLLLGSSATGGGAAPSEITLGTNLSMSGSTLNAAGGGGGTGGNPTALVGLTAVNGAASTFIRSDGAPALDQSIVPTWSGAHTFKLSDAGTGNLVVPVTLAHSSSAAAAASFGVEMDVLAKDSTTDNTPLGLFQWQWTNATHASRASRLSISLNRSGVMSQAFYFSGDGGMSLDSGGSPASPVAGQINLSGGGNGITFSGGATLGKVLQGDGSKYAPSTPTWPTAGGTAGYTIRSDGTNFATYPVQLSNSSTSDNTGFAADQYLTGSSVVVAAGDFKAKGQYHCVFDMVKTNTGTAASVISVRIGTAGTTSDTAQMTFTFGAGTGVADTGSFEVFVNWRTVGSGTSAVVSGYCRGFHNLATTGLFNNAANWTIVGTTSSGFDSSAATTMGLSFNGGTSFSGTNKVVQATIEQ